MDTNESRHVGEKLAQRRGAGQGRRRLHNRAQARVELGQQSTLERDGAEVDTKLRRRGNHRVRLGVYTACRVVRRELAVGDRDIREAVGRLERDVPLEARFVRDFPKRG